MLAFFAWVAPASQAQVKRANRPPVIKHEPVRTAVRDQSLSIRATVTHASGSLKSVTLFYTTSKDAAPFKIVMLNAGTDSYFGSIPSTLLKGTSELSYYIEALDEQDIASETPWYTVKVQTSQATASQPVPAVLPGTGKTAVQGGAAVPAKRVETEKESWSWKGPTIIAGAAAAVVGGAILATSGGGGSDSPPSDGGTTTTNSGTFTGSATRYLEMPGQTPTSSSYPISITVMSSGALSSDSLNPGVHMEAQLSGTDFQMTARVNETNLTGLIAYSGTLLNTRITGTIAGSVTAPSGTNGTYSGVFSATK